MGPQAVCASRLKKLDLKQYPSCLAGSKAKLALTHRPDESRDPESTYREVGYLSSESTCRRNHWPTTSEIVVPNGTTLPMLGSWKPTTLGSRPGTA